MKKLKICWWTRIPNTYQTTLVDALRRAGADVVVCYYQPAYGAERLGMGWREPVPKPWEHRLSAIRNARRAIPDFEDRIQLVAGYSDAVNWKTILWCLVHRKPWFAVSEGTRGRRLSRPVFRLFSWLVDRFSLGIFPEGSRAVEQFAAAGVRREKIVPFRYATMPPPPVDPDARIARRSPGCVFVFAGEFCRRKAVDVLAAAWERMRGDYPEARLILAGGSAGNDFDGAEGSRFDLRAFLKSPGVECAGAVPQEEIYGVIRRGDVMVLPSRYDPWGVALVEGAAAGLAMIGSDATGSAVDLIEPGRNGELVKAGDADSLAAAMRRYAANPALAREHGKAAKEAARTTSGDALAALMVRYLESAC